MFKTQHIYSFVKDIIEQYFTFLTKYLFKGYKLINNS